MFKQTIILLIILFNVSVLHAASPGEPAPKCSALGINNEEFNIEKYQNKVVYLDFWASWCPPCKQSFPILEQLHSELKEKGFEVVAINVDEDKSDALDFLSSSSVNFPIFFDAEGNCPSTYQVMAMPSSYIINKQGIIKKVYLGFHEENESEIRNNITTLLGE